MTMNNLKLTAAFAVFFSAVFIVFFSAAQRQGLGFDGSYFPWVSYAAVCGAMLLGIFFSSFYRSISSSTGDINPLSEALHVLKGAVFWRAICVSPLVFMGLYSVKSGTPGDLPSIFLAFQNGFFWETIMKKPGS